MGKPIFLKLAANYNAEFEGQCELQDIQYVRYAILLNELELNNNENMEEWLGMK